MSTFTKPIERVATASQSCSRCHAGPVERYWLNIGLCVVCWLIGRARKSAC